MVKIGSMNWCKIKRNNYFISIFCLNTIFFEDWIDQSPDNNAYSQPVHILMKFLNASFGFNHHKYPTAKEERDS
jgi:hypothetical protein